MFHSAWRNHVLLLGLTAAVGCTQRVDDRPLEKTEAAASAPSAMHRAAVDPVAYIHEVRRRCEQLEQYTVLLTRYERRGLIIPQWIGPERIACWFRRSPFSVRMKWLDEDVKYGESVYVEGRFDGKVRFVPRIWVPPLSLGINAVSVFAPVRWGEALSPVTDFGIERLMEMTVSSLERNGAEARVRYEGLQNLPELARPAHRIRIDVPEERYPVCTQEILIDATTDLPAACILRYKSGRMNAAYYYTDLRTDVRLTESDFLLDHERSAQSTGSAH